MMRVIIYHVITVSCFFYEEDKGGARNNFPFLIAAWIIWYWARTILRPQYI